MSYVAGALAIVVFVVAFERFGVIQVAAKAVDTSREATRLLRDSTLGDDKKERMLRKASLSLLGGFLSIAIRGLGAFVASLLTLLAFDLTGLADFEAVSRWLAEWEIVIPISVGVAIWYLAKSRH